MEWQVTIEDGSYRKIPDTREDNWVWSPQGVIDMHRPEMWGVVQFTTRTSAEELAVTPLPGREARVGEDFAVHVGLFEKGGGQRAAGVEVHASSPMARGAAFPGSMGCGIALGEAVFAAYIAGGQDTVWPVTRFASFCRCSP